MKKTFFRNAGIAVIGCSWIAAVWWLMGVVMYFDVAQRYRILAGVGIFVLVILAFAVVTTWVEMPGKSEGNLRAKGSTETSAEK